MIKQGDYFERADGKNISDANANTTCRVRTVANRDDGSVLINGKYVFREEEIRQISCAEFKKGKNREVREKNKEEAPAPPLATANKKGSYVRKKNWELFNTGHPTMCVLSINRSNCHLPDQARINGMIYSVLSLVELTSEERQAIDAEYELLAVAKPIVGFGKDTTCSRADTGKPKVGYDTEQDVLRKLWVVRKNSPGKPFEAYMCPFCKENGGQYHIGKRPSEETITRMNAKAEDVSSAAKKTRRSSLFVKWFAYVLLSILIVALGVSAFKH